MTEHTETDEGALSFRFSREIRRAFASMPYAADSRVMKGPIAMGSYRDPLRESDVIEALAALTEVLREVGSEARRVAEDYRHLTTDVAAVRRVLGLPEVGTDG